ncbi:MULTISPECIES: ABC transporter permease subunit [unclassified Streptomyces]|uniref:ABC transporter permease subunit n=1 Tax=unclassified Streptomyces TaxID=2593676 RepID=UPI0036E6554D
MSTLSLRGPVRVTVRLHRWTLWAAVVLAFAGVVTVIATQLWTTSVSDAFADTGCSIRNTTSDCDGTVRHFLDTELRFNHLLRYGGLVMMLLPALVGAFVAGPLIGRELESGTYRLSWSQAVSPARWLVARLAVPAVLTTAGVSVLSAVCTWARTRAERTHYPLEWYDREVYGAMGTVPVGYALCMLALGALVGMVLRRTVGAMIVTVIAYGALVTALNSVRNSLWPTLTATDSIEVGYPWPEGAANAGQGWVTSGGKRLSADVCQNAKDYERCLADNDITLRYLDYHPASHFWPLQLVETGILLALAALAVALTFRVLRRRHG